MRSSEIVGHRRRCCCALSETVPSRVRTLCRGNSIALRLCVQECESVYEHLRKLKAISSQSNGQRLNHYAANNQNFAQWHTFTWNIQIKIAEQKNTTERAERQKSNRITSTTFQAQDKYTHSLVGQLVGRREKESRKKAEKKNRHTAIDWRTECNAKRYMDMMI